MSIIGISSIDDAKKNDENFYPSKGKEGSSKLRRKITIVRSNLKSNLIDNKYF